MKLLTILTYILLFLTWSYIFYFSFKQIIKEKDTKNIFFILFLILIVDAFRTIIESGYFGLFRAGTFYDLLPQELVSLLSSPELIALPKVINLAAALFIIYVFSKHWIPNYKLRQVKEKKDKEKLLKQKRKLLEQKEEFETIFNTSKDGIAILDLDTNFLNCNEEYLNMTGFTKDEILSKSCIELTVPEERSASKKILEEVIKNGYVKNFEKSCLIKNGNKIIVNMSLSMMPDKKRIIISTKDVTQLKLMESQSKHAAMGEMIGNIAHQWRQPLSVISTGATGLKTAKEFDTLTEGFFIETCDAINDNAQFLSKTIDDFKNFIKGERKKVEFDLTENIESFLHLVEGTVKNNSIHIELNLKDITLNGYPNELIQCFINIFNNAKDALKSISEDDRYFFISSQIKNDKLIITFKDTGSGIREDILPRIFEPYFTSKHKSKGTGLGLSMTYNLIVEGMEGTIEVNNITFEHKGKNYKGAQFTISLPLG